MCWPPDASGPQQWSQGHLPTPPLLPPPSQCAAGPAVGSGATHLVDAYCGCGLFALCCADAFEVVAGVEVTPSSARRPRGGKGAGKGGRTEAPLYFSQEKGRSLVRYSVTETE